MAVSAKISGRHGSPANTGTLVPNRVFIGGLPVAPSQNEIADLFSKYGVVTDVKIVPAENSRTKPYGFVTFQTAEEANKALQDTNIVLRDRKLNVAAAYRKNSAQGVPRNGPSTPSTPGYPSSVYSTPSQERSSGPGQSMGTPQQTEMWYPAQTPGPGGSYQNVVYYRNACGQYQFSPMPVSPHPMSHYGGSHMTPYWVQGPSVQQPCYMVYDQPMSGTVGDSATSLVTLTPPAEEASVLDDSEMSGSNVSQATQANKESASTTPVTDSAGAAVAGMGPQQSHAVHLHPQQPQQPVAWSSQPVVYCPHHHSCLMSNHFNRSCQFLAAPSCYSTPLQSSPSMFGSPYVPGAPRRPSRLQRWNSLDANIGQSWSAEPWPRTSLENSYSSETELFSGARRDRPHRATGGGQQVACQLHGMYSPMCVSQEFNIWSQSQNQSHDPCDPNASMAAPASSVVQSSQANVSPASSMSSLSMNLNNGTSSNTQDQLAANGHQTSKP